jgi:hypothetical protein
VDGGNYKSSETQVNAVAEDYAIKQHSIEQITRVTPPQIRLYFTRSARYFIMHINTDLMGSQGVPVNTFLKTIEFLPTFSFHLCYIFTPNAINNSKKAHKPQSLTSRNFPTLVLICLSYIITFARHSIAARG